MSSFSSASASASASQSAPAALPVSSKGADTLVARRRELIEIGVPAARLRRRDLHRPLRGVLLEPGSAVNPVSFEAQVKSLQHLLRPGMFLSGRTAARVYGIPLVGRHTLLEVGAIRPIKPPNRTGVVRGHQLRPGVLLELPRGPAWLPTTPEAWALLARSTSLAGLVMAGDFLISGSRRWAEPLSSIGELTAAAQRFEGTSGTLLRRRALPLLRTGVESPAESLVRLTIIDAGLPEPQTQCPVLAEGRLFSADLGYPQWRIAIEHEGSYHFEGGVEQARRDIERHEAMAAAGWIVLRTTAVDLRNPRNFIARLARAIEAVSGQLVGNAEARVTMP